MADHFEKAKDDILLRTEGNGGPSNRDMLKAMGALAQDVDEAIDALDKKQKARHDQSFKVLSDHLVESGIYDERIAALEQWRHEASEKCVERITKIAEQVARDIHGPVHEAHMAAEHAAAQPKRREDDAAGENHRDERNDFPTGDQRTLFEMILGWSIVKWLVAGACMAAIVWGVSYWASSCAAQKVEEDAIEQGYEMHFEPSPSP